MSIEEGVNLMDNKNFVKFSNLIKFFVLIFSECIVLDNLDSDDIGILLRNFQNNNLCLKIISENFNKNQELISTLFWFSLIANHQNKKYREIYKNFLDNAFNKLSSYYVSKDVKVLILNNLLIMIKLLDIFYIKLNNSNSNENNVNNLYNYTSFHLNVDDILRDDFNLFKQIIVKLNESDLDSLEKFQSILKNNIEFHEGAIDLINKLAENTQKSANTELSQKSLSTDLLEDAAFFVLLPDYTKFFLLNETLNGIKDGEQQYQNFMKKFHQAPKDKDSYEKSMNIIKSKLFDNLYKNFKDDIDYKFISKFIQKVKPYIERIQQKEMTKKIEYDLASIAFDLINRKEKEEPQMALLKKYLSDRTEELNLKEDFKVEKLIKLGHANDVYLVSNTEINQDDPNTIDYYAKSFSRDGRIYAKNGLIDPNELFVYKILEYTGFGPECWFLMKAVSSCYGTISRANFILTKNVGKGEGINFLLDSEENQGLFEKIFSNSKNFAIEISAAASINHIVALWDTFKNSGNYGVVFHNNSLEKLQTNKDLEEKDYNIVFIDHLPNAGNGIISQLYSYKRRKDERYNTTKYSPRQSLIRSNQVKPNKFIELAKNSKEAGFSKDKIIKDVYQRLSDNEADDQQWDKFKAGLKKAKEDVMTILEECEENFYRNEEKTAFEILEDYYNKILSNLEIFDEKYKEMGA
jgi:hypothetical protein